MKKNVYNEMPFTKEEGFHLYCVEKCLDSIINGYNNYVIPSKVWHISNGSSLDYRYVIQLIHLVKKYKSNFRYINTTVKKWNTRGLTSFLYIRWYLVKQVIKSWIR